MLQSPVYRLTWSRVGDLNGIVLWLIKMAYLKRNLSDNWLWCMVYWVIKCYKVKPCLVLVLSHEVNLLTLKLSSIIVYHIFVYDINSNNSIHPLTYISMSGLCQTSLGFVGLSRTMIGFKGSCLTSTQCSSSLAHTYLTGRSYQKLTYL